MIAPEFIKEQGARTSAGHESIHDFENSFRQHGGGNSLYVTQGGDDNHVSRLSVVVKLFSKR